MMGTGFGDSDLFQIWDGKTGDCWRNVTASVMFRCPPERIFIH